MSRNDRRPLSLLVMARCSGYLLLAGLGLTLFPQSSFAQTHSTNNKLQKVRWNDWDFLNQDIIRFETSGNVGDQPGVKDGYQRTGAFISILNQKDRILFLDGQGIVNFESGNWTGNVGLGYRQDLDGIVVGGNAYYGYREYTNGISNHNFSNFGFGIEALMSDWAVRSNAYFANESRRSNGGPFIDVLDPVYVPAEGADPGVQNIMLATQLENWDESLDGFDLSVSRKIPETFSEIGAGVYYLSAEDGPNTWGVNGTAETLVSNNVSVNVSVSHDDLFDTTVYGGVSIYFGGPFIDPISRSKSSRSRLYARVQRRDVVPVLNYTATAPDLMATDATTGDLISVVQVGDSDDIVSAPDLMEADGDFVDIILADPGATFALTEPIVLNDGQRLLSGHVGHEIDTTELGEIPLPETMLGGSPAMLIGADDVNVITLGNQNEISGFQINGGANADAIAGVDVTDFNINRNQIIAPDWDGIDVLSNNLSVVNGLIEGNTITDSTDSGVYLINNNGDLNVDILDNTIAGSGSTNVQLTATGNVGGVIEGNNLDDSDFIGNGLLINTNTISAEIRDNSASNNGLSGINVIADSVASGEVLRIEGNTANSNDEDGIKLQVAGLADSEIFIDGNSAGANGQNGILVDSSGNEDILGVISNNSTNGNTLSGINATNVGGNLILDITDNFAGGNQKKGIVVATGNNFTGDILNNTANLNQLHGIDIAVNDNLIGYISGNTANTNEGFGILALIGKDFTGNFSSNTTNDSQLVSGTSIAVGNDWTGEISDNTGLRNFNIGMDILVVNDLNADLVNNDFNGNEGSGIKVEVQNDFTGNIASNSAFYNEVGGLLALITGDYTGNVTDNNTVFNEGANGLTVQADGNFLGSVTGNTANGNAGIGLLAGGILSMTGDVFNNTASINSDVGIYIVAATSYAGDVTSNTTNDNEKQGFSFLTSNFSGSFNNNTSNDNTLHGFLVLTDDFSGMFNSNTATGNGSFDYSTISLNAPPTVGPFTPNTSTTNTAADFDGNIAAP